ncbi:MAG TPA: 1-(5-phosphoribosyl)-5-amino-4-imidazole-carboxylate carboxylase, partial [Thermoanaerobaculia bacterium]|nr:1-(5-phosphoribosyl)-5-amino-4-imidazole-carboxylate carboxylase [Thermoanaerobaculia bacterium]
MNPQQLRQLLDAVAAGDLSPDQALADLAELPYADLGFAKLDLHRELRSGLPETVYAEGKRLDDLEAIIERLMEGHGRVLVTRLSADAAAAILAGKPEATYHERARILTCGERHEACPGAITILAAGTSDLPVAEEAAVCANWFGHEVERCFDV